MIQIRKFTLVVEAATGNAYFEAIREATGKIRAGYVEGADSNEDGAYFFTSTEDVLDAERPTR